jgi:hypothetical protein
LNLYRGAITEDPGRDLESIEDLDQTFDDPEKGKE